MLFLNVLVILATICSYLSPHISPVQFWQFSFLGLIYPWLLLSNLLFIFYWFFLKKKWVWVSLVCVLLGWSHIGSFVGLSFTKEAPNEKHLKVVTYNVRNLINLRKKNQVRTIDKKKEQAFFNFLKQEEKISILCTQECTTFATKIIKNKFNFVHHFRIPKTGVTSFSKYPIIKKGEVKTNPHDNYCIWVDLKIEDKIIRVYNLHLFSNQVSIIADKIADGNASEKEEIIEGIRAMMSRFSFTARQRADQAERIVNDIAKSPHPVIVCGDFNDTPQSYTYQTISKNLKDTYKEKGRGFGTTYAGNIPALHIDHILVDKNIKVHSLEILKGNFSDHYPVVSKISLPD